MTAQCAWCGVTFEYYCLRGPRRLYCKPRCRYAARDSKRFTPAGTTLTRKCAKCGRLFSFVQITKPHTICLQCKPNRKDTDDRSHAR
jgi:hypothetical protein